MWRRVIPVAAVLSLVLWAAACSGTPECETDDDCPPDYECVSTGGLFSSDRVCLDRSSQRMLELDYGAAGTDAGVCDAGDTS